MYSFSFISLSPPCIPTSILSLFIAEPANLYSFFTQLVINEPVPTIKVGNITFGLKILYFIFFNITNRT